MYLDYLRSLRYFLRQNANLRIVIWKDYVFVVCYDERFESLKKLKRTLLVVVKHYIINLNSKLWKRYYPQSAREGREPKISQRKRLFCLFGRVKSKHAEVHV